MMAIVIGGAGAGFEPGQAVRALRKVVGGARRRGRPSTEASAIKAWPIKVGPIKVGVIKVGAWGGRAAP